MHTLDYTYKAEVIRWIDGDTVELKVDLGFHTKHQSNFRLHGINAPERGTPEASVAADLAGMLAPVGSTVVVQTFKSSDKYGRWLGIVYPAKESWTSTSINQILLANNLAVPFMKERH